MKKYSLLFLMVMASFVAAVQSCEFATPRYGRLECVSLDVFEPRTLTFNCDQNSCSASFACVSNCEIKNTDLEIYCSSGWAKYWTVYVDGQIIARRDPMTPNPVFDKMFYQGQELTIDSHCTDLFQKEAPPVTTTAAVSQKRIQIREGWAGSLPDISIPGTEDCAVAQLLSKTYSQGEVSSFYDPKTGAQEQKPTGTYSSLINLPSNWKIGDSYIFVKDWQTGIADISLTYDKSNNAYWCGGTFGRRKIYNVNQITSPTGSCYAVPTGVYLSDIQCCFPSDCLVYDSSGKMTCNPDAWKCEETKPCNSDLECQQTFSSGICESHQITSWSCDQSKKWGNYAGTCVKATRAVSQCPSDCTSDEYYDDSMGQCKPRITLLDCPPGRCCEEGGNYKPLACSSGLECCKSPGAYTGECKASCEEIPLSLPADQGLTGSEDQSGSYEESPSNNMLFIVLGILVLGGVGVGAYYLTQPKPQVQQHQASAPQVTTNVCGACGHPLSLGTKFCTSCGSKIQLPKKNK